MIPKVFLIKDRIPITVNNIIERIELHDLVQDRMERHIAAEMTVPDQWREIKKHPRQ